MNVLLTFDVEIWCQGWHDLDARFPASFDRYVYGRSSRGDYAIPRTLSILDGHGLKGIFFVEPLFAARFGLKYLKIIVDMIRSAGQEVQLHLHPEWTDEIKPAPIPAASGTFTLLGSGAPIGTGGAGGSGFGGATCGL